jgi:hypothetical protein
MNQSCLFSIGWMVYRFLLITMKMHGAWSLHIMHGQKWQNHTFSVIILFWIGGMSHFKSFHKSIALSLILDYFCNAFEFQVSSNLRM